MGCCGKKKGAKDALDKLKARAKELTASLEERRKESPLRDSCIKCALKHLAQARVLLLEKEKGYPAHYWFAMGHLAEAEDELQREYPEFMEIIRGERLILEIKKTHKISFDIIIVALAEIDDNLLETTTNV